MPPRQVKVRVRQLPAMAVLDLAGDITSDAVEQLRAAYEEAIVPDPAAVLLHLGAVEYINSTGIAVLVGLLARARREHRRMYACGVSPHYREIFEVTRLADYLLVLRRRGRRSGEPHAVRLSRDAGPTFWRYAMTTPAVHTTVRRVRNDAVVIDLAGDVTAAAEPDLLAAWSEASDGGTRLVALNFTGLDYMNSGGIGLLVTLLVRANRSRQRLVAYGLPDHYRQIFGLTRLDEAIGLHDTEAGALSAPASVTGAGGG